MRGLMRVSILLLLQLTLFAGGCISHPEEAAVDIPEPTPPPKPAKGPREHMRQLVQEISAYGRNVSPGFIIIPQNGEELISLTTEPDGAEAEDFLDAVDGFGREDMFYGFSRDNIPTPERYTDQMTAYLDRAVSGGKTVLATDYCSTPANQRDAVERNRNRGYLSYPAESRELDSIPAFPAAPVNHESVETLSDAEDYLYIINPAAYPSREAFVYALDQTFYDVLIIDAFYTERDPLTPEDIEQLQSKPNGNQRLVISYFSIGEAESYRYYWQRDWSRERPEWLKEANPNWLGNFTVQYWHSGWKAILMGSDEGYLDRILSAGFDGVYLDIVDGYERFE